MLKSMYRNKYSSVGDYSDYQESLYFTGGLRLNTRSYIWHPNFLKLDVGAAYFPESNQDDYVVNPDRSEIRTLKGLDLGAILFDSRPLSINSWASWNDSYQNRENLTNIRSLTRRLGSSLAFRNRFLPLYLEYQDIKWDQEEIQSGRLYRTGNRNFEIGTQKSFSERDHSELKYIHGQFTRQDLNNPEIQNMDNIISFRNRLYFDREKKYTLRSSIRNTDRTGNQTNNVFDWRESLLLRLPADFDFRGTYSLYDKDEPMQSMRRNRINAGLSHKLYESLRTGLTYEYSGISHSYYKESRHQSGVNLNYTKKIPAGQLKLSYSYTFLRNQMEAEALFLPVYNESYELMDGEITMLQRPYVDESTVVVRDVTGTLIYREGLDYILVEQGDFLEIQRVPGGQIPNGESVYLDYYFVQSGSYKYDAHTNAFSVRLVLFERFLELYYRGIFMDYSNIEKSDLLVLNYIRGNTFGGLVRVGPAELGAEYELRNSTITPFKQYRCFLNVQKRLNKVLLALYGNYRNYYLIDEELSRNYADVSARCAYEFSRKSKFSLLGSYRKQVGTGIDLDLLTATLEFKTRFHMLHLAAGMDFYLRDYLGDDTNYYGAYIQLKRHF